jgi:hypothetical protein
MINTRGTLGTGGCASRRSITIGFGLALGAMALLASRGSGQAVPDGATNADTEFTLFGQVVDQQSGTVLEGAWVGLTDTDWGSLTDNEGRFRIPDMQAGSISLTVEQLGYETMTWNGPITSGDDLIVLRMEPNLVLLEGLQIVTDRFETRRRSTATRVLAYDAGELSAASERSALDFVRYRTGSTAACGASRDLCVYSRGRIVEPTVYIDEVPFPGGLAYLDTFAPWEFHMIEVYGGGRHIRAYTNQFMERAAEIRLLPLPLFF